MIANNAYQTPGFRGLVMPVQKVCGHCETTFQVPPRRSEAVKFCSTACNSAAKRCTLICATCRVSFERRNHEGFAKYCSRACYHTAMVGVPKNLKEQRYYRTCETCASVFRVTLTRKDTARWCSRACQSISPAWRAATSAAQVGEKSHSWKGGLYKHGTGYVRERGQGISAKSFRFEHRLVMERAMLEMEPTHPFLIDVDGTKRLNSKIDVHHFDLNRSNNDFANLLAVTKQAHARIHHRNQKPEAWECWPHNHAMSHFEKETSCSTP